MRNFINKHTPEWWDGWCWMGVFMVVWSIGWAIHRWGSFSGGLNTGMVIFWCFWLAVRANDWYKKELLDMYRDTSRIKDEIIVSKDRRLAAQIETISIQQAHIDYLKAYLRGKR